MYFVEIIGFIIVMVVHTEKHIIKLLFGIKFDVWNFGWLKMQKWWDK